MSQLTATLLFAPENQLWWAAPYYSLEDWFKYLWKNHLIAPPLTAELFHSFCFGIVLAYLFSIVCALAGFLVQQLEFVCFVYDGCMELPQWEPGLKSGHLDSWDGLRGLLACESLLAKALLRLGVTVLGMASATIAIIAGAGCCAYTPFRVLVRGGKVALLLTF